MLGGVPFGADRDPAQKANKRVELARWDGFLCEVPLDAETQVIAGTLIDSPKRLEDRPDRDRLALRFEQFKKRHNPTVFSTGKVTARLTIRPLLILGIDPRNRFPYPKAVGRMQLQAAIGLWGEHPEEAGIVHCLIDRVRKAPVRLGASAVFGDQWADTLDLAEQITEFDLP